MIEFKNVSFQYEGSEQQIWNVNLSIAQGECVVLTGVSGCGKTTLTRLMNGLAPSYFAGSLSGSICIDDRAITGMAAWEIGKTVGSVFQNPKSQFFSSELAGEVAFGCENHGFSREAIQERTDKSIETFSLSSVRKRPLDVLSSGEKQLIAIASVCTMEPKVIVMDEPSANLDSDAMVRLGALLYRLKEAGHTILLSEHRFHYVRDSFDRLVFMEDGEITSIYSRSEALSLTEAQLTAMGLRPFQPPSFQVGGAFLSKPEDTFQASQISCMLDGRQILEDVTFSSQSGKTLAIAGPNGAGKSTLCRTITGLYRSMGTIQIDGEYLKRKRRTKKSFFVQQDADYQLYAPTVVDEFLIGKRRRQSSGRQLWQG